MIHTKSQLPTKLSALLRTAVADLTKAENTPGYVIDMEDWHNPTFDMEGELVCHVCFAGAVLAFTKQTPFDKYDDGMDYEDDGHRPFDALNQARLYEWRYALSLMGKRYDDHEPKDVAGWYALNAKLGELKRIEYEADAAAFKANMLAAADILEAHNL